MKKFLTFIAIFVAACAFFIGVSLFVPQVQNFALNFAENSLLRRSLQNPQKWIFEMRFVGFLLVCFSVFCIFFNKKFAERLAAAHFFNVTENRSGGGGKIPSLVKF